MINPNNNNQKFYLSPRQRGTIMAALDWFIQTNMHHAANQPENIFNLLRLNGAADPLTADEITHLSESFSFGSSEIIKLKQLAHERKNP